MARVDVVQHDAEANIWHKAGDSISASGLVRPNEGGGFVVVKLGRVQVFIDHDDAVELEVQLSKALDTLRVRPVSERIDSLSSHAAAT